LFYRHPHNLEDGGNQTRESPVPQRSLCIADGRRPSRTVADHRWLVFARLSLQLPLAVS
jgi:hypothetical protein